MADSPGQPSDLVIAGGGFAGSLLALVMARRGYSVQLADLHRVYPEDFRCEKLGPEQAAILAELGALEAIAARAGLEPQAAAEVVRRGLRYPDMIAGLRHAWPETIRFHEGRIIAVRTSEDLQTLELSTGQRLDGRLAVLATGRSERLRRLLGVSRRTLRERHSLCIGLSLRAGDGRPPLRPMLIHGGRGGDGLGFVSLFPMDGAMRVNLFCYRDAGGDWARSFRNDPLHALIEAFPALGSELDGAEVLGPAEFGLIDLYRTEGFLQPGAVLIGDAFCSSCPATAMGVMRVLTDVRQLALVHAPKWLSTPGMGAEKIAAFYADPRKRRIDRLSRRRAEIGRFEATARGPVGQVFRWARGLTREIAARRARVTAAAA